MPPDVARQAIDLMREHDLDTWVYSGNDWLITKIEAPHVAREAWTVKFASWGRTLPCSAMLGPRSILLTFDLNQIKSPHSRLSLY